MPPCLHGHANSARFAPEAGAINDRPMGLQDYNRKRDFRVSAEPPGRLGRTPTGRSFVIQKHAATRLHYDFRLELDGVLKSWSVPKGPSFDTAVKRLAVAVEDHPIDYGGFEGIIPKGQYGGGTVLLWDRGTWQPVGDAAAGLAAGHLKFDLEGEKLHGRWALVRLKPRARRPGREATDDRSWLLVKDRDAYARPEAEWNVTEARPESVASGRGLPEIAASADRVWHSNVGRSDPGKLTGARAAPLPAKLSVAGARRARATPVGEAWVHEVEVAGARVLCRVEDGRARLFDVGGRERTSALGALARAVQAVPAHDALFDGVATALGPDGVTRARGAADTLYLFDVPHLDGSDLTRVPLVERKSVLQSLIAASGPAPGLRYTDHVVGSGAETFAAACGLGAPGLVSKRAAGRYQAGARSDWRVVRCPPAKKDTKKNATTKTNATTAASTGVAAPALTNAKAKTRTKTNATKKAASATAKRAAPEVSLPDQKIARPAPVGKSPARGEVRVAGVKLTHPERVLYPEVGVTKLELASFYEEIGEALVPYLEDRPLTLVRCPDGVAGQSFYVRHPGAWAPPELRRFSITSGTNAGPTMIADDIPGLVALAQMNVLEIHAWNARVSHLETPDRMVFDLDPGPHVDWPAMVEAAHRVRDVLAQFELTTFVKTTGSKGLHVVVPLTGRAGWTETLTFSRTIAQLIARAEPARYSAGLAKAGREDKVFIDYLRNRRGATSVSVYSTRARATAPVSVPITWEALGPATRSDSFHVGDRAAWFGRRRADPWAAYAGTRQSLTATHLEDAEALLRHLK